MHGEKKTKEKNYLAVPAQVAARVDRKRVVNQFITVKVKEMKSRSNTTIGMDKCEVLPSPWTEQIHNAE